MKVKGAVEEVKIWHMLSPPDCHFLKRPFLPSTMENWQFNPIKSPLQPLDCILLLGAGEILEIFPESECVYNALCHKWAQESGQKGGKDIGVIIAGLRLPGLHPSSVIISSPFLPPFLCSTQPSPSPLAWIYQCREYGHTAGMPPWPLVAVTQQHNTVWQILWQL